MRKLHQNTAYLVVHNILSRYSHYYTVPGRLYKIIKENGKWKGRLLHQSYSSHGAQKTVHFKQIYVYILYTLESKPKKNTCDIMIKLTRYNSFDQSDQKFKYIGGTLTTPACPSNGWCVEFMSSNFHEDRR